jgi:hypothetical protein
MSVYNRRCPKLHKVQTVQWNVRAHLKHLWHLLPTFGYKQSISGNPKTLFLVAFSSNTLLLNTTMER